MVVRIPVYQQNQASVTVTVETNEPRRQSVETVCLAPPL